MLCKWSSRLEFLTWKLSYLMNTIISNFIFINALTLNNNSLKFIDSYKSTTRQNRFRIFMLFCFLFPPIFTFNFCLILLKQTSHKTSKDFWLVNPFIFNVYTISKMHIPSYLMYKSSSYYISLSEFSMFVHVTSRKEVFCHPFQILCWVSINKKDLLL